MDKTSKKVSGKSASTNGRKEKTSAAKKTGSTSKKAATGSLTIKCGEDLCLREVQDLYQELKKASDSQSIVIDLSETKQTDTSGLQLLYSFSRKIAQKGGNVSLDKVTDEFLETVRLLGMSESLGLQKE